MPPDKSGLPNRIANTVFYAAVFAVVALVRWLHLEAMPDALPKLGQTSDSLVFTDMAALPWSDAGLWGGLKPPLTAIFYKLLQIRPDAIVAFQITCALLCWGFLAWEISRVISRPWLRYAAYTLTLILGLSTDIILWDFMLLSESLSMSFFVLLAAMALRMMRTWCLLSLISLVIAGGLWAFCRESNAWLLLGLALAIGLIGLFYRPKRTVCIVLALCWCAFFAANSISSKMSAQSFTIPATPRQAAFNLPPRMGQRWVFPFLNVLTQRILPDQSRVKWFAERGMPVTPDLIHLSGKWGAADDFAAYRLDSLQPFRNWLLSKGQACYMRYLILNFRTTIREPWLNFKSLLSSDYGEELPAGFVPILPARIAPSIYPAPKFPFWPLLFGLTALSGLVLAALDRRGTWLIPIGLLLLIYPHAWLIWHGDAMAVARHALLFQVHLRLAFWLTLFFAVDTLGRMLTFKYRGDPEAKSSHLKTAQ